jgi:hypothetical protein
MRSQRFQIPKTLLKMNNKVGELIFPDVKIYHKATEIKTVYYGIQT